MLSFYNLDTINNTNIDYPDIYFTPDYGRACEYSDNAIWELCKFKDLLYVYLKKTTEFDNKTYYDLITPYGYSGYYFKLQETYNEFIGLFRKEAKKRNYITEVLRQNPYLDIKIENYDILTSKTIYCCNYDNKEEYLNQLKKSQKKMVNKALKQTLTIEYNEIKKNDLSNDSIFNKMYTKNMDFVNSKNYYYFNKYYFTKLESFNNLILVKILNENKEIIGCALFFIYKNFIHYHLGCNDRSLNCITDFLFYSVIDKLCNKSKLLILGGGLKEGDSLSKFKEKISNKKYNYTIYKNIINHEIYEKLSKNTNTNTNYFPSYRN